MYALTLVIVFVLFTRLVLTNFRWALFVVAAMLPAYVIRFPLGPLPTTVLEGLFLLVLVCWSVQLYQAGDRAERWQRIKQSLFFKPGLLLVGAAALSVIWTENSWSALGIWRAYFLEPFLFYAILVDQVKTERDWRPFFVALGCTTLALTGLAVFQRFTGWWSPTWEWTQAGSRRVTGVYTSPNALGLFIVPVMAVYAWYITQRKTHQRWVAAVLLAGILAILLAVSKGAIIAFIATLLLLAWLTTKRRKQVLFGLAIVAAIILLSPLRAPFLQLATLQTDSGQSRIQLYKGTVEIVKGHPLTGTGLAGFGPAFERVRPDQYTEKLIYPHNIFLNFWVETGLLGLAAIIWIMVIVARTAYKLRGSIQHPAWAWILALTPMLIHGLIDVPYFKNDLAMLTWVMLAGLAVCYTNDNSV